MLKEKVLKTIKKYELIKDEDNIVVGVSGGPDSMTLLNILIEIKNTSNIKFKIFVAHINHMIRQEADEETQYVKEFCEKNNIECFVTRQKVEQLAKEQKIGTEEAGRNLRYNFFEEVAIKTNSNKIVTAHTSNDNAETVLMNIIRGSGTSGLKGIEPIRDNKFIRPLIDCTRQEIEQYCEENRLNPRYDKTNKENIYTRNKVRNMLIPYIEENFNPSIIDSINRLSSLATEENKYIEKIVKEEYNRILIKDNKKEKKLKEELGNKALETKKEIILSLKEFNKLDLVIKNRIVLYTINSLCGTAKGIEKVHIEDIIKLCKNNIGNKYLTPNKSIKVFINKGKIFFIKLI